MSTQVSVNVNADPVKVLECAYETLVSMKKKQWEYAVDNDIIDKKLLFASVNGKFNLFGPIAQRFVCLVTVEKLDKDTCRLTIASVLNANMVALYDSVSLNSDFLKRFSQNLKTIDIGSTGE